MTSNDDHDKTEANTNTNVGRLIEGYDRGEGYGDRFERLWTTGGSSGPRSMGPNVTTVDGGIDDFYRLLTDNVSSGNRTEARGRLMESGLDAEQLEWDFMTY